jgi:hypothetical protein
MVTDGLMQTFINWVVIVGVVIYALPWLASKIAEAVNVLQRASWRLADKEREERRTFSTDGQKSNFYIASSDKKDS